MCSPENPEGDASLTTAGYSQGDVLLQTAKVQVKNQLTGQMLHARVLFDSCSQLSYATPSLQRKLNLVSTKQKEISIQTFGKTDSRKTLDQVDLVILSTDKKKFQLVVL